MFDEQNIKIKLRVSECRTKLKIFFPGFELFIMIIRLGETTLRVDNYTHIHRDRIKTVTFNNLPPAVIIVG